MNTATPERLPELNDEQIESMRFAIMTDVNGSARTKTRRYRQLVGAAAVIIAVGGVGTGIVRMPAGNGGGDMASSSAARDESAAGPEFSSGSQAAAGDSAGSLAGKDSVVPPTSRAAREVVTTGTLSMTVDKPVLAAQKISTWVEAAGGRVDSRSEEAPSGDFGGNVHLVVRVPQTKVTSSIETFRALGTVHSVNVSDEDVTAQGQDLDARIKALGISVDRLESLMKSSTSTADLLKAETALSQRQAELDSLAAQRKGLSDHVALSSLEIDINAKSTPNSVSPSGFWGGIVSGWNGLVSAIDGGVHGLGVILPWGAALALLGAVSWTARRVIRASTKG